MPGTLPVIKISSEIFAILPLYCGFNSVVRLGRVTKAESRRRDEEERGERGKGGKGQTKKEEEEKIEKGEGRRGREVRCAVQARQNEGR